jgi:hypothetical protein
MPRVLDTDNNDGNQLMALVRPVGPLQLPLFVVCRPQGFGCWLFLIVPGLISTCSTPYNGPQELSMFPYPPRSLGNWGPVGSARAFGLSRIVANPLRTACSRVGVTIHHTLLFDPRLQSHNP